VRMENAMMVPQLLQGSEWLIVIVIVVVLIFGANKIPDLAKSLGRASGEFQKGKVESELEVAKMKAQAGQPAQPADSDRDKLMRAAKELGIATEGRTDDEIRAEVKKAIA
jgi:sec-independent protein translocase protein TatA